jgi:tripeptidyl-peptidase I
MILTDKLSSYFAKYNPPYPYYEGNASFGANGGVYNRKGRGIPDVSANGDNIAVFLRGNFTFNGGTSAATPIFASVINLVCQIRSFFLVDVG